MNTYPYEVTVILDEHDEIVEYTGDEIVRCKDCKWSRPYFVIADNSNRLCCDYYRGLDEDVSGDDFCSFGERSE